MPFRALRLPAVGASPITSNGGEAFRRRKLWCMWILLPLFLSPDAIRPARALSAAKRGCFFLCFQRAAGCPGNPGDAEVPGWGGGGMLSKGVEKKAPSQKDATTRPLTCPPSMLRTAARIAAREACARGRPLNSTTVVPLTLSRTLISGRFEYFLDTGNQNGTRFTTGQLCRDPFPCAQEEGTHTAPRGSSATRTTAEG